MTLSLERRRRLIELANAYELLVVEDTPYRALRYEGESLPTLKSLDTEGRVLHLGSFSKILAPAMRLGWAVASPEILERLTLLKLAADTQNSTLNMSATSEYLSRYDIEAHLARAIPVYRRKRDLMLATMAETFPASVRFTTPDGGLFVWLTLPGLDAAAFMAETLLPEAKIAWVPGATFFPVDQDPGHGPPQLLRRARRPARPRDHRARPAAAAPGPLSANGAAAPLGGPELDSLMPTRRIRVVPATALREGFDAIRREAGVPEAFPPDVHAEAVAAAAPAADGRAPRPAVRDDRPARLARPRPGAAHRAPRRRASRAATRSPTSARSSRRAARSTREAHARAA